MTTLRHLAFALGVGLWSAGSAIAQTPPAEPADNGWNVWENKGFGKPYTPPPGVVDPNVDMKTPVRDQVHAMNAQAYYTLFADLLKTNPPAAADAPMVEKLAKIGIVPGKSFDWSKVDPAMQKALGDEIKPTQGKILANFKALGENTNDWVYTKKTGLYGTDYLGRASVTLVGLGANRPEDAIYPTSETGVDGQPYEGANNYVVHFDKGQFAKREEIIRDASHELIKRLPLKR